jgi:DNA-nicking Smr family endonuclease
MAGSRDQDPDRHAFERAFADVRPLRARAPKRAAAPPEPDAGRLPRPGGARRPSAEALRVEREGNGIITGRRPSTHVSIVDALEDPRLEVDDELDLHGLRTRQAGTEVRRFLQESQREGKRWVSIVVGKGLHSPGGKGSLRDYVVRALSEGASARFVLAFRTAPRRLGGTGALVVRLGDRLR